MATENTPRKVLAWEVTDDKKSVSLQSVDEKGGAAPEDEKDDEPQGMANYYGWLAFCTLGMITTLALYGLVLEYATSGNRKLHEVSFVFVTTSIYAITAYVARELFGEKPTEISKYQMLILSVTSIASTITSVRSLRYVIYPVQVLFKSCKPVPVMLFGTILGKKYPLRKYVNVIIITTGVALFMGAGSSTRKAGGGETTLMGAVLLTISLCFDGATGAYEDKLMGNDHVEPFDLMYNIQLGKSVISFCTLVATNGLSTFAKTIYDGGFTLVVLGLTGAMGQVFVFITISKFGALNCALIGLARKILSLLLSFVLYGHTLNAFQTMGLLLSLVAMISNFYEKGGGGGHGGKKDKVLEGDRKEAGPEERQPLMVESNLEEGEEESAQSKIEMTQQQTIPVRARVEKEKPASPAGARSDALRQYAAKVSTTTTTTASSSFTSSSSSTPPKPEPNLLDVENPAAAVMAMFTPPLSAAPVASPASGASSVSADELGGLTVDALRLTPAKDAGGSSTKGKEHPHRVRHR